MNLQILVLLSVVYIAHGQSCDGTFFKSADTGRFLARKGPMLVSTASTGDKWCYDETLVKNKQCTTIKLQTGNLFLDSNETGKVYVLAANGGVYQKWNITKSNQLINCKTGRALDSIAQIGNAFTNTINGKKSQKWLQST